MDTLALMSPLAERVLGDARLYDRVQTLVGQDQLLARVGAVLRDAEPGVLLDVGAGTASFYPIVPATWVPCPWSSEASGSFASKSNSAAIRPARSSCVRRIPVSMIPIRADPATDGPR